jgi:hypothetical protein
MIRAATRMFEIIYFALIIQVPTKLKGEPMIPLLAMSWFHLVFVLVLPNIHDICRNLKSRQNILQISINPETLFLHLFHSSNG